MKTTQRPTKRLVAEDRRTSIETAAAQLFSAHGYDGTTLDDIAAASGVTKPIVYRHFDSKKALYLVLLSKHRDELPRFFDRAPSNLPLRERFQAVLEDWFAYVREHGYAWSMLFGDSTGDEEIAAYREEVKDRARAVLAMFIGAQREVPIPESEVEPLAEFMRSGGVGLALYAIRNPDVSHEVLVGVGMRIFDGLLQTTR